MVPGDPMMKQLMGKTLQGMASPEEKEKFGELWQKRVEAILLTQELWDQMITIH